MNQMSSETLFPGWGFKRTYRIQQINAIFGQYTLMVIFSLSYNPFRQLRVLVSTVRNLTKVNCDKNCLWAISWSWDNTYGNCNKGRNVKLSELTTRVSVCLVKLDEILIILLPRRIPSNSLFPWHRFAVLKPPHKPNSIKRVNTFLCQCLSVVIFPLRHDPLRQFRILVGSGNYYPRALL